MFYEEAMIDGALHWRGTPNGKWEPCRPARLNALIAELRAELTASPAQPSGFVLVPVEATEAMLEGIAQALDYPSVFMGGPSKLSRRKAELAYAAMIYAAPIEQESGND